MSLKASAIYARGSAGLKASFTSMTDLLSWVN